MTYRNRKMLYRIKQFYYALFAKVKKSEYAWVAKTLNNQEFALFSKQPLAEQRHAIDVALEIYNQQNLVKSLYGIDQYNNLLKAALLHDCGKSLIKYRLRHRVIIVLTRYLPEKYKNNLIKHRTALGRILLLDNLHPKWGRHLAAKAGANIDIQKLILNHHNPSNQVEQLLAKYDNKH